jgi:hypothetical protein
MEMGLFFNPYKGLNYEPLIGFKEYKIGIVATGYFCYNDIKLKKG